MKVSIITPCYNAASHIAATVQSIQRQTLNDWELILVDDGSTDNTAEVIHELAAQDVRIKLLCKSNGGTASARQAGLNIAQGEYIQLLDADDQIDANKLLRQTQKMDQEGLDVSYTDWCYIYPDGKKGEIEGMHCSLVRLLAFWGTFGTLPIHSYMYRRSYLEQHQIRFTTAIREREDWDWHIQVYSASPNVNRIKAYCGAMYMVSPTGKTAGGKIEKLRGGNLRFLAYEIQNKRGYQRGLLLLRLAIELSFMLLSAVKYRLWGQVRLLAIFHSSWRERLQLACAIMLQPIAWVVIVIYIIKTRLQ
ncbi:MAG: glycosyltransferase family 2 protein [Paludibacteraceae bacterium]|nr:glycosyltransferase family 2 protein [Paludibacteraceae bacterium]